MLAAAVRLNYYRPQRYVWLKIAAAAAGAGNGVLVAIFGRNPAAANHENTMEDGNDPSAQA